MGEKSVVLVTGAAGGMGGATVGRLIRDGFQVAATDINEPGLDVVARDVGGDCMLFPCDLTNESDTRAMVAKVEKEMGPVDALVNLIGWVGTTRFHEEDSEYWYKVMNINFFAVLYVTHPVLLGMQARKRGKIVNISSDAGRIGTSAEVVYSGAKAGLMGLSKSLARENARYNINVNVICPGLTDTPLLQSEIEQDPDLIHRMSRLIPFRRIGKPEEIASAVSFFCSPDSDYITGQVLSVSGGLTMVG